MSKSAFVEVGWRPMGLNIRLRSYVYYYYYYYYYYYTGVGCQMAHANLGGQLATHFKRQYLSIYASQSPKKYIFGKFRVLSVY